MSILTLQNLGMGFEGKTLFRGVNLGLEPGERLALVGANGCGKTTLLRCVTGQLQPEEGQAALGRLVQLGYAEQEAGMGSQTGTVFDEALAVHARLLALEQELEGLAQNLLIQHSDEAIRRQEELRLEYERGGGLTYRARTRSMLLGLGFLPGEIDGPAHILSGGQRVKLRLGRLLLSGADLLLLDEPTNHLDLQAVAWLEEFLRSYAGAVILVSHDRWFLDKAATKTAILRHGKLAVYAGGYTAALEQQAAQAVLERRHYENQMAEIKRIEGIVEQQRSFGQARNFVTIASKEKQIERLRADLHEPERSLKDLRFHFLEGPETGNEVLRLHALAKHFDEKALFAGVEGLIEKGDRAFVLGPNGCGKSTLLKILRRSVPASAGYFAWGAHVRPGFYDQDLSDVRSSKTVLEEVWDSARTLTQTEVRSMLGHFLFGGDAVFQRVERLSGGERARIALLKLLLSGANVLVLDEPTNHLDVPSREALEAALAQFSGTIICVSHDRYFISKLATRVFALEQDGLRPCGGYEDYAAQAGASDGAKAQASKKPPNEWQKKKLDQQERKRQKAALAAAEAEIARLEAQQAALHARLSDPATAADFEAVCALTGELDGCQARLTAALADWETLAAETEDGQA